MTNTIITSKQCVNQRKETPPKMATNISNCHQRKIEPEVLNSMMKEVHPPYLNNYCISELCEACYFLFFFAICVIILFTLKHKEIVHLSSAE